MRLKEQIRYCKTIKELPSFKEIKAIPKGVELKVIFTSPLWLNKDKIVKQWKFEHPDFMILTPHEESSVCIVKLITDEEIVKHQDFFAKCARDYKNLATSLIEDFIKKKELDINYDFPLEVLNPTQSKGYNQVGEMGDWRYAFHGIHCGFTNLKTNQHVETSLIYGEEFGELDPYFFVNYIKSTKDYLPLPINIYNDYHDGKRILKKMVELGRFERINSNWPNQYGIALYDPNRKKIKTHKYEYVGDDGVLSFGNEKRNSFVSRLSRKLKKLFS